MKSDNKFSAKGGNIRLFLQGGLGNQLIQQAYALGVAKTSSSRVTINTILMSRQIAVARRASHRNIAFQSLIDTEIERKRRIAIASASDLLLCLATKSKRMVDDNVEHSELMRRLNEFRDERPINLMGYFHRSEAFGLNAEAYWARLAERLNDMFGRQASAEDEIAIHARRGDYLTDKNKLIYAQVTIDSQIQIAKEMQKKVGSKCRIRIYTDSPELVHREIPANLRSDVIIHEDSDGAKNFLSLMNHKFIICSNSTYSLVAARLSHSTWRQDTIHTIPDRWYVDKKKNDSQMREWSTLTFAKATTFTTESATMGNSS